MVSRTADGTLPDCTERNAYVGTKKIGHAITYEHALALFTQRVRACRVWEPKNWPKQDGVRSTLAACSNTGMQRVIANRVCMRA